MVGTIGPLVKVARRQWFGSLVLFVTGSALGGMILGTAISSAGLMLLPPAPPVALLLVLAATMGVAALVDVGILRWRVPTMQRSVPQQWWLRHGPFRSALAYGVVLGTGVTTFVPVASFHALLFALLLSGPAGPLIGLTYGVARALPVIVSSGVILCGSDDRALGRWLVHHRSILRRVPVFALLLVVVAAIRSM